MCLKDFEEQILILLLAIQLFFLHIIQISISSFYHLQTKIIDFSQEWIRIESSHSKFYSLRQSFLKLKVGDIFILIMIDKTKQIKGKELSREEADYGNVGSDKKRVFRISVLDTTKTLSYIQWKNAYLQYKKFI